MAEKNGEYGVNETRRVNANIKESLFLMRIYSR